MNGHEAGIPVRLMMETVIENGQQRDVHKATAPGIIYRKKDATFLKYTEVIEEAGSVNNVIKITNEGIVILRGGSVSMRQKFLIGQTTEGMYDTPYGQLWMETTTHKMNFRYNQQRNEGDLLLRYNLVLQGEDTGTFTIKMNFQEA
ncbi:hypothetical protein A374_00035 [Fictibacillus macauensis ZFHKF-1]|uniref:DUF1934 domain-containing protein n=1 Tax=Fictibacillus macauensis ZFHKF-1 TaxID=1196324 RepID=I8ANQ8_9BACL|nr:DUF1934 domain-containing protein [Fictibacillus macauensis]EIT87469.1 hypothetical protein A374_00035 [Fictibacillus macauensis ZFHKF-1]